MTAVALLAGATQPLASRLHGFDADDPAFPDNNFKVPPGHTKCCEFVIDLGSYTQSRAARAARAAG